MSNRPMYKCYKQMVCPNCQRIRIKELIPEYGRKYFCPECEVIWSRNKPTQLCARCGVNVVSDRVEGAKICSECFVIAMETLFQECEQDE